MSEQLDADRGSQPPPNFFGSDFIANPYPFFKQMRSEGPIIQGELLYGQRAWFVTRWDETIQVLKDQRFSVDPREFDDRIDRWRGSEGRTMPAAAFWNGRTMISSDGDDHTRLRTLVARVFTPRQIESLRPRIQILADELLDRVQSRGAMDLVNDFAYPLPINVISEMLGVPAENRGLIREWSAAIATGGAVEREKEVYAKMMAFSDYVARMVAEKRKNPKDDLISHLVQIEESGDRLSEMELLSTVALLIFAGHETTSNLIGSGVLALLDHPDQLARLKADPSLIPTAVEELLRFSSPVISPVTRFAKEDVEIDGRLIQPGDLVIVLLASANRDEAQFTDPEELDIARALNRHLAFGHGMHHCLGAPLARLEGEIAFSTLFRRMPDLRLNIPRDQVTWRGALHLRGLTSLPVAF